MALNRFEIFWKEVGFLSKVVDLSKEWKEWVVENLSRGCTKESIVDRMVQNNFDKEYSISVVNEIEQIKNGVIQTETRKDVDEYIYERSRFKQDGHYVKTSDREIRVVARVEKPVVVVIENLFSNEECDELINLSKEKLQRSKIVDPKTGLEEIIESRTSYGTFFKLNENEFIARLDRRIAEVMNWPVENGEGIQILNYQVGSEYKPHFDYFSVNNPGSKVHLAKGGQRVSTLVMYLNDVEEGGGTSFPKIGLTVAPKKGSAVYFEYCNSLGQVDPLTLHAGDPVIKGEKWIATKWMRQREYK